ncbi:hypothetical protein CONCODRAFT_72918 [Conidiobolus coronatus NRRL 28638]|uniref:Uncharacterized protein n=1 Tax=Conidiobolus coronatus (strain ATCC 28846 / CBS 209.66 / NRRL 28638) TaxID=796925 RepID=A0A137NXD7_CONC2|nr:hypothetical protein CONCODRAFT_72918 [Conidiobolus coronatus NRRL 28638]|eukprot:KXN67503.1 hypothetical protein CONCODRAFT_72918 [Conidiobolus coronatus NRRL 28638]
MNDVFKFIKIQNSIIDYGNLIIGQVNKLESKFTNIEIAQIKTLTRVESYCVNFSDLSIRYNVLSIKDRCIEQDVLCKVFEHFKSGIVLIFDMYSQIYNNETFVNLGDKWYQISNILSGIETALATLINEITDEEFIETHSLEYISRSFSVTHAIIDKFRGVTIDTQIQSENSVPSLSPNYTYISAYVDKIRISVNNLYQIIKYFGCKYDVFQIENCDKLISFISQIFNIFNYQVELFYNELENDFKQVLYRIDEEHSQEVKLLKDSMENEINLIEIAYSSMLKELKAQAD